MEQFEIERKQNRFIYLIKDTNMEFYLLIPNNSNVSITLNIMESIDNEAVKKITEVIDKVIIIPVLNSNVINYLTSELPTYNQADNYFSNLINKTYNILKHNGLNIDSKVYLNNNFKFYNFNNYFVKKFNGRVSLINLNLEQKEETKENPFLNNNIFEETANIPTVQNTESSPITNDLSHIYNEEVMTKESVQQPKVENKEPGFVSYVLLGVVVAILSLVFLYLIL